LKVPKLLNGKFELFKVESFNYWKCEVSTFEVEFENCNFSRLKVTTFKIEKFQFFRIWRFQLYKVGGFNFSRLKVPSFLRLEVSFSNAKSFNVLKFQHS
jgi:hypothetical protein